MLDRVMDVFEQPWDDTYHDVMYVLPAKLIKIGVNKSIASVLVYLYFRNCRSTNGHRDDHDTFKRQVASALKMQ